MKTIAQIAAQIAGPLTRHDPSDMSVADAREFLARWVEPITDTDTVAVPEALDRVLAEDVVSPISVPAHDNSAMDGYAFDGSALRHGAALSLRCVGSAYAGRAWAGRVGPGECVKIMTGAVMPAGLDTVVPVELATADGDAVQVPPGAVRPGANRRLLGEDIMAGSAALRRGQRLGPAALGLLASLGLPTVRVVRRLRVAYFSTGDELLSLGEAPREGAVYDSNRYTIGGLLRRLGAEVIDLGVVGDEPERLETTFRDAAASADAIVTSGGVSMGDADHTQALMQRLGEVAFWKIAMRPGRPLAVGHIARSNGSSVPLFGLPGNPVAAMVSFLSLVRPALQTLMGEPMQAPVLLQARITEAVRKRPGRTEYQRGVVRRAPEGTLEVRTTGHQGSGMLSSMVQANGLIVLPHDQGDTAVGDTVEVMMFDGLA